MEYSRSYLQGLQEKVKEAEAKRNKEVVEKIAYKFIHEVMIAASQGKTSYIYTPDTQISLTDLLAGFKRIFPECDVTYVENQNHICIDWSIQIPPLPASPTNDR